MTHLRKNAIAAVACIESEHSLSKENITLLQRHSEHGGVYLF